MQIEHSNFLINIHFVNIKQTTQLQLVPEDKVAILWLTSLMTDVRRISACALSSVLSTWLARSLAVTIFTLAQAGTIWTDYDKERTWRARTYRRSMIIYPPSPNPITSTLSWQPGAR